MIKIELNKLQKALDCVGRDEGRKYLTFISLKKINDFLEIVSTNGHILYFSKNYHVFDEATEEEIKLLEKGILVKTKEKKLKENKKDYYDFIELSFINENKIIAKNKKNEVLFDINDDKYIEYINYKDVEPHDIVYDKNDKDYEKYNEEKLNKGYTEFYEIYEILKKHRYTCYNGATRICWEKNGVSKFFYGDNEFFLSIGRNF